MGGPETARSREYMLMAAAYSPDAVEVKIKERTMSWRGPNWLTRLANSDLLNNHSRPRHLQHARLCLQIPGHDRPVRAESGVVDLCDPAIFIAEMLIKHLGLGSMGTGAWLERARRHDRLDVHRGDHGGGRACFFRRLGAQNVFPSRAPHVGVLHQS